MEISTRAQIITRRTYSRPLNDEGTLFETWEQTIARVIKHQRFLWERAITQKAWPDMPLNDLTEDMHEWLKLNNEQEAELERLRELLLERKVAVAGRTLWLGGTEIARKIAMSQFNCAAINAETVHDIVDIFWALLNGSGMGFRPVSGTLTGFRKVIPKITIIESVRSPEEKGTEFNQETIEDYIIKVGTVLAWANQLVRFSG
jgi:ribonucleoside-triphosphate reductase